jgi:hypothetical protein
MLALQSGTINTASSPLAGRVRRVAVFIGLAGALAACGESTAVEPRPPSPAAITSGSSTPAPTPTPSGNVVPAFRTPSGPAHIYQETGSLYSFIYTMHGLLISRYVLYDDGSFELQFSSARYGLFNYRGVYERKSDQINLMFNDANRGGPWNAAATVDGNQLRVVYNGIMVGADFENGIYVE